MVILYELHGTFSVPRAPGQKNYSCLPDHFSLTAQTSAKERLPGNAVGAGMLCRAFVPRETLNGAGGGESCCTLIGKWFQGLELARSARVFQETKGRWEMPGQPRERREERRV